VTSAFVGERVTGIEPALSAWEADVLPLNYTRAPARRGRGHSTKGPDLLGRPILTADDLDTRTPQQVDEVWRAAIVTDPDVLPAEYTDATRRRAAERLAQRETPARRDIQVSGAHQRRDVRRTRGFYQDLYRQFHLERAQAGQSSRLHFELYELPRLFRDVADQCDNLFQPIPGRQDCPRRDSVRGRAGAVCGCVAVTLPVLVADLLDSAEGVRAGGRPSLNRPGRGAQGRCSRFPFGSVP
jgi:hypothetical protein